ncbi:MAG: dimethylmenaquinone methyltransferase, partial [Acidobacteria bacterium]|nr:dimethylmenaquinone methyltransferase [Acidobacteriota bacterium]
GTVVLLLAAAGMAPAQLFTLDQQSLIRLTPKNPFARFEDGRPKVPDALLERLKALSVEDVWSVLPGKGYRNQYDGDWQKLHPERKLIGRVVTAQFMPLRPDVGDIIAAEGKQQGRYGGQNQWVIDRLQPGDVLVVDLFGKVENGTFMGNNLAVAIYTATGTGLIVDGGIRDTDGVFPVPMPIYFRGAHPTPIGEVMLTGFNVPVTIGKTTVMPGDVVLGDREGVYFIPPQFVEEIVTKGEETIIHDEWTQQMLRTGKYKSSDVYSTPHDPALKKQYEEYKLRRMKERGRP